MCNVKSAGYQIIALKPRKRKRFVICGYGHTKTELTNPARRRRTPHWWCRTWGWSPWPRGSRLWWWSCSAPGLLCPTRRQHDLASLLAAWLHCEAQPHWHDPAQHMQVGSEQTSALLICSYFYILGCNRGSYISEDVHLLMAAFICVHDVETIIMLIASLALHRWGCPKQRFSSGWGDWSFPGLNKIIAQLCWTLGGAVFRAQLMACIF